LNEKNIQLSLSLDKLALFNMKTDKLRADSLLSLDDSTATF